MPDFDPTIASKVIPPSIPQSNALGGVSQLVDLQKGLTDLQSTRLTLAAKKRAGDLMALAPSLDDGIAAMTRDPGVSGFAPDVISTLQGIRSAQVSMQGEQQVQAGSGLNAVLTSLLPALNDPTTFDADMAARMKTLSPSAQSAVSAAMPQIKASLFDGLPKDPAQAAEVYQQRLGAMLVGAGFSADGIRSVTGSMAPQMVTVTGPKGEQIPMQIGGPITGGTGIDSLPHGPTSSESAQLTHEGDIAASVEGDMNSAAQAIPKTLQTINNTVDALSAMSPGGGADMRSSLGKAMEFFKNAGVSGISQDMIDKVANGNLAASQELTTLLRSFVTQQLKVASEGTGAGRIKSEVDAFLQMADQTTTPEALLGILGYARQALQIDYDMSKKLQDFKGKLSDPNSVESSYGLPGYYRWYNDHELDFSKLPPVTTSGQSLTPDTKPKVNTPDKGGAPKTLDDIFGP